MVHFTHLRLNGFKSFADSTELEIGKGLTGIVGPNGCGKSNLVEALRWVMGESSAKRMRGSGMEDVIFAGTSSRTSKNRCDVSLVLDNPYKDAPNPFEEMDKIEVTRMIERDNGSTYRVNGKAVRARDVQMLFADIVSGYNSPALVSQGRVTIMINAKPTERRQILEESAGVSGLYARRHEAELRLKAAESNLLRLDDILGQLEERYGALQKQVRQATRYKNLSQQIRDLQALLLYVEWKTAKDLAQSLTSELESLEQNIRQIMTEIASHTTRQTEASAKIPSLREADASLAAQIQTHLIEKQRSEDTLKRIDDDIEKAETVLKQSQQDQAYEQDMIGSQKTALKMREAELESLNAAEDQTTALEAKRAEKEASQEKLNTLEKEWENLRHDISAMQANKEAVLQRIATLSDTIKAQETALLGAETALKDLNSEDKAANEITALQSRIDELTAQIGHQRETLQSIEEQRTQIQTEVKTLEDIWHSENTENEKILSEINILESLLKEKDKENHVAVLGKIKPHKGYEIALAKAMGDTLLAALEDKEANQYWQALSYTPQDLPELSAHFEPLSSKVKAPEALSICLSQIGVALNDLSAEETLKALKPGQMAVTKQGDVYRWDGYVITAKSQSATALHLERKSRLETLQASQKTLVQKLEQAKLYLEKEKQKLDTILVEKRQNESELYASEAKLTETQNALQSLKAASEGKLTERARLEERCSALRNDLENARKLLTEANAAETQLDEKARSEKEKRSNVYKDQILQARETLSQLSRDYERLTYDIETRSNRISILTSDISQIKTRLESSEKRIAELEARKMEALQSIEALKQKPQSLTEALNQALDKISSLETSRKGTKEALSAAEAVLEAVNKDLKEAETCLSSEKEKRAALAAHLSGHQTRQIEALNALQSEGFDKPETLLTALEWPENEPIPALDTIRTKYERLKGERENMGSVNLMAAEEAESSAKEIDTMRSEREDLVEAISKLRQAIQKLNREARQRMEEAFTKVNEHYQKLFTQLFGGGQAHLELIESDDILDAGLEIFAQPPGKKLQNLGLLSGGEQTLASIALIFAMFLTKPAPICVLDEIDAPLDDANVDRVCTMIEDIARITETRFLVITHHRMTMARMDRLYGVTMAERGISQLVSVDLQQTLFDDLQAAE